MSIPYGECSMPWNRWYAPGEKPSCLSGCSDGRQLKDHRTAGRRELGPAVFQLTGSLMDSRPHAVDAAEVGDDVRRSGEVRHDPQPGDQPEVIYQMEVRWVGHRHGDASGFATERKDDATPGKVLGDQLGHLGINNLAT